MVIAVWYLPPSELSRPDNAPGFDPGIAPEIPFNASRVPSLRLDRNLALQCFSFFKMHTTASAEGDVRFIIEVPLSGQSRLPDRDFVKLELTNFAPGVNTRIYVYTYILPQFSV